MSNIPDATEVSPLRLPLSGLFNSTVVEECDYSPDEGSGTESTKPSTPRVSTKIYDLGSKKHTLVEPIDAIYDYLLQDEILAIFPELELYGEGATESEARADLQNELIDLFEDLDSTPDSDLGDIPKAWKRILNRIIERV